MSRLLVINGPNLNLLGSREPDIYGSMTLRQLEALCHDWAASVDASVETFQTNHEGVIIDRIHDARGHVDGMVINAGALTHYSYAIHDAIVASGIPTVEVHISNVQQREPWRRVSVIEPACIHSVYGRGTDGYRWALQHLAHTLDHPPETIAYGTAPQQVGDLRIPEGSGPHPIVVLVHGGFWRDHWTRDLMDGLAVDLRATGFATWNVEYRRVGSDGGWPATAQDIAAAVDHLAEIAVSDVDLKRMAIVGHSAGGHLALWAAGRGRLTSGPGSDPLVTPTLAVGLAPITDLVAAQEQKLGDGAADAFLASAREHTSLYRGFSPIEMLPLAEPQLIVHGSADTDVPIEMSDEYVRSARAQGDVVEYLRLDDVDHMTLIDPRSEGWGMVKVHLQRQL